MSDVIDLDLPAAYRYLGALRAVIAEVLQGIAALPDPAGFIYNVQLAAQEIAVNVIDHAYGGDPGDGRIAVHLRLDETAREFSITLRDTGRSFDIGVIQAPDLDVPGESGYGLFLARELMDAVEYAPGKGFNEWQLRKSWQI